MTYARVSCPFCEKEFDSTQIKIKEISHTGTKFQLHCCPKCRKTIHITASD